MKISLKHAVRAAVFLALAASLAGCGDNSTKQDGAPSPQDVGAGKYPPANAPAKKK